MACFDHSDRPESPSPQRKSIDILARGTDNSNPLCSRGESANFRSQGTHYIATDHTAPLAEATYSLSQRFVDESSGAARRPQVWVSLAAQADKEGWPARFLAALPNMRLPAQPPPARTPSR
jgi:hypothetical protein